MPKYRVEWMDQHNVERHSTVTAVNKDAAAERVLDEEGADEICEVTEV